MPRFHVTHARDGKFERRGLRSYFEYRDLGIKRATKGKVLAPVLPAPGGKAPARDRQGAAWRMALPRYRCAVRVRAEGLGALRVRERRARDDEGRELLLPAAAHPPSRAQALAQPRDDRGRGAGELQDVGFT